MKRLHVIIMTIVLLSLPMAAMANTKVERHLDTGITYYIIGLPDMAAGEFEKALKADPSNSDSYLLLAMLELSNGNVDEAAALFEDARRRGEDLEIVRAILGDLYRQKGDLERARVEYEAALAVDPEAVRALYGLGLIAETNREFAEAIAKYRAASELVWDFPEVFEHLARLLRETGANDEAVEVLERAVMFNARNAALHYELGLCYWVIGETSKARHQFDRTLQLDENYEAARTKLQELK